MRPGMAIVLATIKTPRGEFRTKDAFLKSNVAGSAAGSSEGRTVRGYGRPLVPARVAWWPTVFYSRPG